MSKLKEQWQVSKALLPHLSIYQIHSATLETGVLQNKAVLDQLAFLKEEYAIKIGITTTGANQVEVIKAALDGHLNKVEYDTLSIFNLEIPKSCPDIPNALLNTRNNWRNEEQYDVQARSLAKLFKDNMKKYQADLNKEILGVEPVV